MKYSYEVYSIMKEIYEPYLSDKDDRDELIEMVDSYDLETLFCEVCVWQGMKPNLVASVYEMFYGVGVNKPVKRLF